MALCIKASQVGEGTRTWHGSHVSCVSNAHLQPPLRPSIKKSNAVGDVGFILLFLMQTMP
jgi:hypothetical protein